MCVCTLLVDRVSRAPKVQILA
jgi:hypothetical protein